MKYVLPSDGRPSGKLGKEPILDNLRNVYDYKISEQQVHYSVRLSKNISLFFFFYCNLGFTKIHTGSYIKMLAKMLQIDT